MLFKDAANEEPYPQQRAVVVHFTVVLLRGGEAVGKCGQLAELERVRILTEQGGKVGWSRCGGADSIMPHSDALFMWVGGQLAELERLGVLHQYVKNS